MQPEKDMADTCECGGLQFQETMTFVPFEELLLPDFNSLTLKCDMNEKVTAKKAPQKLLKARKVNIYSRHVFDEEDDDKEVNIGESVTVLDGYAAFRHSFQTAVLTANMVLSVGNVVTDAN